MEYREIPKLSSSKSELGVGHRPKNIPYAGNKSSGNPSFRNSSKDTVRPVADQ